MINGENSPKMHLSDKIQPNKSWTRQPIKLGLLKTGIRISYSYSIFVKEFCYAHFGVKLG